MTIIKKELVAICEQYGIPHNSRDKKKYLAKSINEHFKIDVISEKANSIFILNPKWRLKLNNNLLNERYNMYKDLTIKKLAKKRKKDREGNADNELIMTINNKKISVYKFDSVRRKRNEERKIISMSQDERKKYVINLLLEKGVKYESL